MASGEYYASIVYNAETLKRLNKTVSSTFHMGLKLIYFAICAGLMLLGAKVGLTTSRGVALICIACFMLPSIRMLDNNRANQTIKKLNGKTITVSYAFSNSKFTCSGAGEKNEFKYDSIIRMVDQGKYLYLFPNSNQAYMIDTSTIKGGDADSFKSFIAKKVGLEWTKPASIAFMNLKQLRFNKKNTRKVKEE